MYAKAKVSMEWVEFMIRKYDIGMFLVYIIILCLIVSYKYPQNSENLMKMTSDDPFVIENKEFTLADYAYTENKSSIFFLLKDENDNTYTKNSGNSGKMAGFLYFFAAFALPFHTHG